MKILKNLIIIGLILGLFDSCNLINGTSKYKNSTEVFIESLLNEDYDKSISFMAMDNSIAKKTNNDSLKLNLLDFRQTIVKDFGKELKYNFVKAERNNLSVENNATIAYIEFYNKKDYGVFEVIFDNSTNKIISLQISKNKKSIPDRTYFWLFGLFAICIPIFNIYVIIQVKRSGLKRKWLKYIMIVIFNVPTITYMAINGLSFKLLNFQFLLGVSFNLMGYVNSFISIGIPIGGLYWIWKLYKLKTE